MLNHGSIYADLRDNAKYADPANKAIEGFGNGMTAVAVRTKKLTEQSSEVSSIGFIDFMDTTLAVGQLLSAVNALMKKHTQAGCEILLRVKIPDHLRSIPENMDREYLDVSFDDLDALNPQIADGIVDCLISNQLNHAVALLMAGKPLPDSFLKPTTNGIT